MLNKKGFMLFCPVCKLAPLTVARGNQRRYFKVIESDKEKHDIDCPYRHEVASRKETGNGDPEEERVCHGQRMGRSICGFKRV